VNPSSRRSSNYLIAATLLIVINLISSVNDVLVYYVGQHIHPIQIAFIRFFVTMLSVLPFMLPKGRLYFKTRMLRMHFFRAAVGVVAIAATTFSVLKVPLLKNTCILFSEPLIFLGLASVFLKEHVDIGRWGCAIVGFLGILVMTYQDIQTFNGWVLVSVLSAASFAFITLIAKKMYASEPLYTMLFYFGLGTSILFLVPAIMVWSPLTWLQALLLIIVGINGNLMQVCMFKAFDLAEVSSYLPLRYTEMLFTLAFGYYLFGQKPSVSTMIGGMIIVAAALTLAILERNKEK
jgi:drug/metabolite transporter (DMT)-like permease